MDYREQPCWVGGEATPSWDVRHQLERSTYQISLSQSTQAIAPENFPNLHKVANMRKRKLDSTFGNYKSYKQSLFTLSNKETGRHCSELPLKVAAKCQGKILMDSRRYLV